jgi:hypothetical protein
MGNEERTSSGWFASEAPGVGNSEAANRQLRRRYESLRDDYDELLDRLAEVEDRLHRAEQSPTGDTLSGGMSPALADAISSPLFALRDQYSSAADQLTALAASLDDIGWRTFKGQRPAEPAPEPPREPEPAAPEPSLPDAPTTAVSVQADSSDLGALLDFQEQVSKLPGVARVSLSQIQEDRAMLTVELRSEEPQGS